MLLGSLPMYPLRPEIDLLISSNDGAIKLQADKRTSYCTHSVRIRQYSIYAISSDVEICVGRVTASVFAKSREALQLLLYSYDKAAKKSDLKRRCSLKGLLEKLNQPRANPQGYLSRTYFNLFGLLNPRHAPSLSNAELFRFSVV